MFIVGKNVCLRQVELEDLPIFQEHRNIYADSRFYRTVKPITSDNQKMYWQNVINSPNHIVFTIVDTQFDIVVGEIRASNITQYQAAEIGLWIAEAFRHKGYATEALKLFLDFVFGRANLNRIEAQIAEDNTDSIEFFKRNGFVYEGKLRQVTYYDFEYHDVIVMSMLKGDYTPK